MKETFGQRFTRFRKNKGLTQEDIATRVNISSQAVSKWENDISSPDISILGDLADILGVSLDELLGKENMKPTEVLPEDKRKDVDKMILKIVVDGADGDKIRVNLPLAIVKVCLESGIAMPEVNGNKALANIDFENIFRLCEKGVIGELVRVDTADGDHISVVAE